MFMLKKISVFMYIILGLLSYIYIFPSINNAMITGCRKEVFFCNDWRYIIMLNTLVTVITLLLLILISLAKKRKIKFVGVTILFITTLISYNWLYTNRFSYLLARSYVSIDNKSVLMTHQDLYFYSTLFYIPFFITSLWIVSDWFYFNIWKKKK
jgi:hypothetical protein